MKLRDIIPLILGKRPDVLRALNVATDCTWTVVGFQYRCVHGHLLDRYNVDPKANDRFWLTALAGAHADTVRKAER